MRCRFVLPHWLPLPLTGFPVPYPPARARRALFPGGEGGDQGYFMQGAAPLASPGLNPGGTGAGGESRAGGGLAPALPTRLAAAVSGGVACFLCRLPTLPLVYCLAPEPPVPLPQRGRGRPRLFHARGKAPCIPGVEPGRHRSRGGESRAGGGACLLCCLPTLPLACFPAPYPPSPLPHRGRGRLKVYFAGAPPPAPRH